MAMIGTVVTQHFNQPPINQSINQSGLLH